MVKMMITFLRRRRNKKTTKSKSKENKISLLRILLMRYCLIWKWYVWSLTLADLHSVVGMSWDIRANGRQELCTRSFLCAAAHRCLRPPFWIAGMHLEALTKWIWWGGRCWSFRGYYQQHDGLVLAFFAVRNQNTEKESEHFFLRHCIRQFIRDFPWCPSGFWKTSYE